MTTEEVRGLRSPPPVPIKRPLILIRTPRKETVSFTTKEKGTSFTKCDRVA